MSRETKELTNCDENEKKAKNGRDVYSNNS